MATKTTVRNPKGNPSGKGGKEQRYTVDEVERALRNSLGNVSIAATVLKCERQTIYEYMERYPDRLRPIRGQCRADIADIAEGHLLVAVRSGKEWAVSQALRLYGKYIDVGESLDITSDGAPIVQSAPAVTFNVSFVKSRFKKEDA
ncbi:hypothetical protein [Bradyrhizobium sp. Leo121]|uniref:hypothetical protein n=1 Tax=Bradyrhizobium sp. Leo121 TaxID=1571195 RepID=UPI0010296553|nr:hypothetical protein [Bradyrhizobium sp. Leo121]RZN30517.1 hypothetical protein CWO90_20485 [Bradyrhizobium sp. Leo121]